MVRLNVPRLQKKYKISKQIISVLQLSLYQLMAAVHRTENDKAEKIKELYRNAFEVVKNLTEEDKVNFDDSIESMIDQYTDIDK